MESYVITSLHIYLCCIAWVSVVCEMLRDGDHSSEGISFRPDRERESSNVTFIRVQQCIDMQRAAAVCQTLLQRVV